MHQDGKADILPIIMMIKAHSTQSAYSAGGGTFNSVPPSWGGFWWIRHINT